jgi:hypothetical protein
VPQPKQKPPLSIRVTTIRPDGKRVESVIEFTPKQLRREGMEEARVKAAVMKRRRLAVVYNVVKDIIGTVSDAKCADRRFGTVNEMLRETARHVIVDIIRKEPHRAHRRTAADTVLKNLAPYPTKSALARTIARIRRKAG